MYLLFWFMFVVSIPKFLTFDAIQLFLCQLNNTWTFLINCTNYLVTWGLFFCIDLLENDGIRYIFLENGESIIYLLSLEVLGERN